MPASSLSSALLGQPAAPALTWRDHLLNIIDPGWRSGEYDHGQLLLVPSFDNPRTQWKSAVVMGVKLRRIGVGCAA
jgi:hypothetical protein